jgi:hypothetical protein
VIVGDQAALDWCAGEPVVPDRCVEGEQPLHDAGPQAGRDTPAVALEAVRAGAGVRGAARGIRRPARRRHRGRAALRGADQAEEFGRRTGVPGELVVWLRSAKILAHFNMLG